MLDLSVLEEITEEQLLIQEAIKEKRMATDIETVPLGNRINPLKDKISIVTVGTKNYSCIYKMIKGESLPNKLISLLEDPDIEIVTHNVYFDKRFLDYVFDINTTNTFCTLNTERLLNIGNFGYSNDLASTLYRYFLIEMDKESRNYLMKGRFSEKEDEYALRDIKYLFPLQEEQVERIRQIDPTLESLRIENRVVNILSNMTTNGVVFDIKLWEEYKVVLGILKDRLYQHILDSCNISYTIDRFDGVIESSLNLDSPIQLLDLLRKNKVFINETGEKILLKELISGRLNKFQENLIQSILWYRKVSKATIIDFAKMVDEDGKLRGVVNSLGANSSRMSSNSPNMQNIAKPYKFYDEFLIKILKDNNFDKFVQFDDKDKEHVYIDFRKLFIPPKGYKWFTCDFSQVELRVMADHVKLWPLINTFNLNDDSDDGCPHCTTAREVFQNPNITKKDSERQTAKIINFGCLCNGGGIKVLINAALDEGVRMSYSQADEIIEGIKKAYPQIDKWVEDLYKEVNFYGFIKLCGGYVVHVPHEERRPTKLRSLKIQGKAAVMLKAAMVRVDDWLSENKLHDFIKIVMTVHDEISYIIHENYIHLAEKIRDLMTEAAGKYMEDVPCTADYKVTETWVK